MITYADDIKFYKSFNFVDEKSSRIALHSDLDSLDNWANNWKLPFNLSKCSLLQFGHSHLAHDYTFSGTCILSKSQEKDFGVTISTDLKPPVHVAKVVKQAEMCLAVIKRTI